MNLFESTSIPTVIAAGIYIVNLIAIFVVVFTERKTPTASLAWILILALVPVVGFVFYILLNQNISRYQIDKLTEDEESVRDRVLGYQKFHIDNDDIPGLNDEAEKWKDLIRLHQNYAGSIYIPDNSCEIITDGKELFRKMFEDFERAEKSINCEFFIMKNDEMGRAFLDVLTKKAKEGVEVRLLIDSQGSNQINRIVLKDYLSAGGKVGYFFQPKLHKLGVKIGIKLNYRNHRKLVVIDDKTGYTGGHNVAREYIGLKKKFGYWRDTFVRIRGSAVLELSARFIQDWRFTTKEEIELNVKDIIPEKAGSCGMQIVSCGPDSPKQEVKRGYLKMITFAENKITIQTPYFVPDPSILEALKMAALSGIDVRIMIPCKPDHVFVYWATYSYVGELLRNGCRAFIYEKGFLHAKTITVDGEVTSVGSTNFDNRSFRLNFETNAFIYDAGFAGRMEAAFEKDLEDSRELTYTDYLSRGKMIKFKEAISRLLSDIL